MSKSFGGGGALMEEATWTNCRGEFAPDFTLGAFIDLYAPGLAEWEAFWLALRAGPFKLRAFRDGEPIPLPESVAWIFAEQKVASVWVSVVSGTVTAICHFYGGDAELLDIDPREVVNELEFESVLAIMRFVAAAVGSPVVAVGEGVSPANAFLRVSSDGQAEFLRAGSVRHAEQAAAPDRDGK